MERQEPVHRLGRRGLQRQGRGRGRAGRRAAPESGLLPDVVHTSVLRRAIRTGELALHAADRHWIPVQRIWRLNERHYGALQGKNKKQTLRGVRRGAVHALAPLLRRRRRRRSPTTTSARRSATRATRTCRRSCARARSASRTSSSACCRTGTTRSCRDLRAGTTVLVAAHGNSLRALVKHLDGISDEAIAELNIPTGIPLRYDLDADAAAASAGGRVPRPGRRRRPSRPPPAVANQGR